MQTRSVSHLLMPHPFVTRLSASIILTADIDKWNGQIFLPWTRGDFNYLVYFKVDTRWYYIYIYYQYSHLPGVTSLTPGYSCGSPSAKYGNPKRKGWNCTVSNHSKTWTMYIINRFYMCSTLYLPPLHILVYFLIVLNSWQIKKQR